MSGAVRILLKEIVVERTEREPFFGVILEQLEIFVRRPQSYLGKIQYVLAEKHITEKQLQNAHAGDVISTLEELQEIELRTARLTSLETDIAEKTLTIAEKTAEKENTKATTKTMNTNGAPENETCETNAARINAAIDGAGRALAWLKQQKKGVADHISLSAVPGVAQVRAHASKVATAGTTPVGCEFSGTAKPSQVPVSP